MKSFILTIVCAAACTAQSPDTEWGRVRAYLSGGVVLSRDDAAFSQQTPYLGFNLDKNWMSGQKWLINSFFEARLTSIAVVQDGVTFPSSQKAAQVTAGVYAPFRTTRWTFGEQEQSLFIAPLLIAGCQTPTSSQEDRFYNASGGGLRLGHFREAKDKDAAPELLSWLDVVYGRFTSFHDPHRRLNVEGTLKAPGTPLVVGFAANIGRSGGARDDLRILIGTRFDLGAVIAKLKQ